ncbi:hypothetical protein [Rhodospirillum sp. A1_3_36]|uniref:hypothetical protein n=1 Tax=Rhodospirillum sp. A1_3_36 TaxID=3391666 RepID=UPI0039A5BEE6
MGDLGIIDGFMATFSRTIDSGFGFLSGDVAFLTTILIGIDITWPVSSGRWGARTTSWDGCCARCSMWASSPIC